MFPVFYQVVTKISDYLTAGQSLYVRDFACAVFVSPNNFGSLFRIREALDTAMPVATMKLEDCFGFVMVAINWVTFDDSFTPVATFMMMDVFASMLRYIL